MTTEPTVPTSFRADPRLLAELDAIAARLHMSRNALLHLIVTAAVATGFEAAVASGWKPPWEAGR